jgi:hypothetical protein
MYLDKGDNRSALNYMQRSLRLAEQYGLKEQVADASLKLSKFYRKSGNMIETFKYYKRNIEVGAASTTLMPFKK